jgi:hypothetical protein
MVLCLKLTASDRSLGCRVGTTAKLTRKPVHQARDTRFLKGKSVGNSDQGIVKDDKAQEQPKDKKRAQTVHETEPDKSVSRENTRDPASRKGPVLE